MSRKAKCIILAEDLRTQRLLRYYAMRLFDPRSIEMRDLPAGSQAADQYIREAYEEEVREYRRLNRGIRACVLVVHTDADTRTVRTRDQQLDRILTDADMLRREDHESIAHVIPKRHTETWIYWHAGQSVDEDYDCKRDPANPPRFPGALKRNIDARLEQFAHFLYEKSRNHAVLPPDTPDSLRLAIPEFRRLEH